MTENEAKIIIDVSKIDDVIDFWDDLIFELKNYFLTHAIVSSVVQAKLNKIKKQQAALCVLFPEEEFQNNSKIGSIDVSLSKVDKLIVAFRMYNEKKNDLKLFLSQAYELSHIEYLLLTYLQLEKKYRSFWYYPAAKNSVLEDVKMSKEPDPMEVLSSLKQAEMKLGKPLTYQLLTESFNGLPKLLQREVKRLTLLQDLEDARKV